MNRKNAMALFRLGRGFAGNERGIGWLPWFSARGKPVTGARIAVLEAEGLFQVTGAGPHGGIGTRTKAGHEALQAQFPNAMAPFRAGFRAHVVREREVVEEIEWRTKVRRTRLANLAKARAARLNHSTPA